MAPPSPEIYKYKPYVDGLRAIAILIVVGAHVDFPGLSGGFVGVDVFFVISGYLIIGQIVSDIAKDRFNLLDFYARRTLRILPAFLFVSIVCMAFATTMFMQPEVKEFAESFLLSTLMLANHHYLAHQGYFDSAAFTKPLLHMWSLGVEEQFYWLGPILLMGMTAAAANVRPDNARRLWVALSALLTIVSFATCIAFTYPAGRPNVSFYIMPTRGWEFILGGIVPALAPVFRKYPAWTAEAFGWAGLAAILAAAIVFAPATAYPSYRAALPALGAMLVILGGLLDLNCRPARALATWPMVRIGLISYSLYLWHWPLISFVRTMNYGQQNVAQEAATVTLSFALAILTFRFVESPIRVWRKSQPFNRANVVALGAAACLVIAGAGYVWALRIAPQFLPQIAGLEPPSTSTTKYPPVRHQGLLLGDSHATAIQIPLLEFARREGSAMRVTARAGCAPILQSTVIADSGERASYCDPFYQQIKFDNSEFVIIAARWNYFLGLPPSDPYYRSALLVALDKTKATASPYDVLK
jgi:peptidoglycan/LPS O-acetylase OafA/YrhL